MDSSTLRLTTLCENTVGRGGVVAEWGFSILIEAGDRRILLDAGMGSSTLQNAHSLGIDVSTVDTIALSHNHYDHTGGLPSMLSEIDGTVPVLAHPEVWGLKYGLNKKTGVYRFIGLPYRREYLESLGAEFELSENPQWITEDIATSGEEPMVTSYEQVADQFFSKLGGEFVPDTLPDDMSVFIRTELGLVVVLGCAHRGMINVIRHAQKVMGIDDVYMVVGGTHLISASEERVDKTIDALREIDVTWLGVSHCTGFPAAAKLSTAFPDRFFTNNAGTKIEFPFG